MNFCQFITKQLNIICIYIYIVYQKVLNKFYNAEARHSSRASRFKPSLLKHQHDTHIVTYYTAGTHAHKRINLQQSCSIFGSALFARFEFNALSQQFRIFESCEKPARFLNKTFQRSEHQMTLNVNILCYYMDYQRDRF